MGFSKILYKQYSEKENPQNLNPENYDIPEISNNKFKKIMPKRDNIIYTGTPSSEYLTKILNTHEDDYFKHNIAIEGETEYLNNITEAKQYIEYSIKTVGNSFETSKTDGDKNLAEITISNNMNSGVKNQNNIFDLKSFYQFYKALISFIYVSSNELLGPFKISKIKNKKRKSTKSKSIKNGNKKTQRQFLFGEFFYNKKYVYIVEIEHDLSYKKLSQYVLRKYNLYFDQKEYKKNNIDDDVIER